MDILLVTSRETKRWIVPKGNLGSKRPPHVRAAMEAEEEAGVRGSVATNPVGRFCYMKRLASGRAVNAKVDLYPLRVEVELDEFKERAERQRCWFSVEEASGLVEEPELAALIRGFRADER